MESREKVEKEDSLTQLKEFNAQLEKLSSLSTLNLNFLLSGEGPDDIYYKAFADIYRDLLPWIARGNTFTYSARELREACHYSKALEVINLCRTIYLEAHPEATLPEAKAHLRVESYDGGWARDEGSVMGSRGFKNATRGRHTNASSSSGRENQKGKAFRQDLW